MQPQVPSFSVCQLPVAVLFQYNSRPHNQASLQHWLFPLKTFSHDVPTLHQDISSFKEYSVLPGCSDVILCSMSDVTNSVNGG